MIPFSTILWARTSDIVDFRWLRISFPEPYQRALHVCSLDTIIDSVEKSPSLEATSRSAPQQIPHRL
jgi:hypothetical protein